MLTTLLHGGSPYAPRQCRTSARKQDEPLKKVHGWRKAGQGWVGGQ